MSAESTTLAQRLLIGAVRVYRLLLSAWLGPSCRFEPTCSTYAIEALQRHGAAAGTYLTLSRLVRCQPFCRGGHDPVPDRAPSLFRHLVDAAPQAPADSCSSTPNPRPHP